MKYPAFFIFVLGHELTHHFIRDLDVKIIIDEYICDKGGFFILDVISL